MKEVTRFVYTSLARMLFLSTKVYFSRCGEHTFHRREVILAFRETERRVRVSLLHWPFLKFF